MSGLFKNFLGMNVAFYKISFHCLFGWTQDFILHSVSVMCYIYWFMYVGPPLNPWKEVSVMWLIIHSLWCWMWTFILLRNFMSMLIGVTGLGYSFLYSSQILVTECFWPWKTIWKMAALSVLGITWEELVAVLRSLGKI